MTKYQDLTGRTFGRLTVVERAGSQDGRALWLCRCECGKTTITSTNRLNSGNTKSCGCLFLETVSNTGKSNTVHGGCSRLYKKHQRLYQVWENMRQRCNNPKSKPYPNYCGRGIKICAEWENSFEAFKAWALETGYDYDAPYGKLTLDRIDCNGDYCPENCRWVDMKVQADNRRSGRSKIGQYTAAREVGAT